MTIERRKDRAGPIWQWSAGEIASAIAERAVPAAEVMAVVIDRAKAENPAINAIVEERYDAALAEARAVDDATTKGETMGPLAGVPVTIKVNVDQAGCAAATHHEDPV